MRLKTDQYARKISDLGYYNGKDAWAKMDREESLAWADGRIGRPAQLSNAKKFTERFSPGQHVRCTLRYKTYKGTVLGFRRHRYRGWMMGLLLDSGRIKEVTIDPKGYESSDYLEDFEWLVDPNGTTISILSSHDLIVIVTKLAA